MFGTPPTDATLAQRIATLEAQLAALAGTVAANAGAAGDQLEAVSAERQQGDAASIQSVNAVGDASVRRDEAIDTRLGDEIITRAGQADNFKTRIGILEVGQVAIGKDAAAAVDAADRAEIAVGMALLAAGGVPYADAAAGLLAVADGQEFVAYGPTGSYATRYLKSGDVAIVQDGYPNRAALEATLDEFAALDGSVTRIIPPTLANQPDWAELTIDSDDRPVAGFTKKGRYLAANGGRMSHLFGGMEDRLVPLIELWAELTLDASDQFVRGTRVDGTSWVAKAGHLARDYGAGDVPDLVRTSEQSIGGVEIAEYIDLTVDSDDRPVSALDLNGRYYRANRGRMSHLFGGPEAGRSTPAVKLWSYLTLDSNGRFVSGTRVDGSRWIAKKGVVTRDLRAGDLFSVSPLVQIWSTLTLDKDARFVSGVKIDGTRWIARSGVIVRDGGEIATGGGLVLTFVSANGDSTTDGDGLMQALGVGWESARWTNQLEMLLGVAVINRGANGQTAEQIAVRTGGIIPSASVVGGVIPASGAVNIDNISIPNFLVRANQPSLTLLVDLIVDDGTAVRGTLARLSASTMSFTRSSIGAAKAATIVDIVSVTGRNDMAGFSIFGAATNNEPTAQPTQTLDQVKGYYRAMVSAAPGAFLCWGPLDRGYQERAGTPNGDFIRAVEAWLRMEFGLWFCDVRGYLSSPRALQDALIIDPSFVKMVSADPQMDDDLSVAANVVPPSFRYPGVHLNPLGHKLQARFFDRRIRALFNILQAA